MSRLTRWLIALTAAMSFVGTAPAFAGTGSSVTVVAALSPATAHVGSTTVVTGVVGTRRSGVAVHVQHKVGHVWVGIGLVKTVAGGRFSVTVATPKKAAVWELRAVTATAVSGLMRQRVVIAAFAVRATAPVSVVAGTPIVVTGAVSRHASGSVTLQIYQAKLWHTLAVAKLSKASAFRFSSRRPAGSYAIRVVKAFTATTAGGVSAKLTVTVRPAATPTQPTTPSTLALTPASLPGAVVGIAYTATLVASGGVAPYQWSTVSGALPAGLALSSAGVISGLATAAGSSSFTVAVADSAGGHATAAMSLTATVSPYAQNTVKAWGLNDDGELGSGGTTDSAVPTTVPGLTGVVAVAGSDTAGYALRFDGTVWGWGANDEGELGDGGTAATAVPVQAVGLSDVTAIAAGESNAFALRSDGTVWSWGDNVSGGLGDGSANDSHLPVQISGLNHVTAIAAFRAGGFALESDGTVWAWGDNNWDELGTAQTPPSSEVPVQVGGLSGITAIAAGEFNGYALRNDGTVWGWGADTYGALDDQPALQSAVPVRIGALANVTSIAAGAFAGYALLTNGSVMSWGDNQGGQLGDGSSTLSDVVAPVQGLSDITAIGTGLGTGVGAATGNAYALRANGTVVAWGAGGVGLGSAATANAVTPTAVTGLTQVVGLGSAPYGAAYAIVGPAGSQPRTCLVADPVTRLMTHTAGHRVGVSRQSCALLRWLVALVVAASVAGAPPAFAGTGRSVTVVADVSPSTAHVGSSAEVTGVVGTGKSGVAVRVQRKVGGTWVGVGHGKSVAGGRFAVPVTTPKKAAVWQLRAVTPSAVSGVIRLRTVTAVFTVRASAAASVLVGAPIVVTGAVSRHAAGTVTLQSYQEKSWHTLASAKLSKTSAFRLSWHQPAASYAVRVVKAFTAATAGGASRTMRVTVRPAVTPAQPTATPAAPTLPSTLAIACANLPGAVVGIAYTATLVASGGVVPYEWSVASGTLPAGLTLTSGGVVSGVATSAGSSAFTVAVADSAGGQAAAAMTVTATLSPYADNTVKAWGDNNQGVLGGSGDTSSSVPTTVPGLTGVVAVAGSDSDAYALRFDGTIGAWGSNGLGELGDGTDHAATAPVQVVGLHDVTAIAAGQDTGYAVRSDGTLWSWGANYLGDLGDDSLNDSNVPVQVTGLRNVTAVAALNSGGYALESDGSVWAWGTNSDDQLGTDEYPPYSDVPMQVNGLTGITAIAATQLNGYALRDDGTVWGWGDDSYGELDDQPLQESWTPVQIPDLVHVDSITAGALSGYALLADGSVWSWGYNAGGSLGDGDEAPTDTPEQVVGLSDITAIGAGSGNGYALTAKGTVLAWGPAGDGLARSGSADEAAAIAVSGLTRVVGLGSAPFGSAYAIVGPVGVGRAPAPPPIR